MKRLVAIAGAILLSTGTPGLAHRLDEYLQATMFSVEKDRVTAQMRLTPGVAVFRIVLASIDTDADGIISAAEGSAYAERVLRDLSLAIDDHRLQLDLVSAKFANTGEMKQGRGEIQIEFRAAMPPGRSRRRLIFKNHHLRNIAAYLVNSEVPHDQDIRLSSQSRNEDQSVYQLDYEQAGVSSGPLSFGWWSGERVCMAAAVLLLFGRLAWLWRAGSRRAVASQAAARSGQTLLR